MSKNFGGTTDNPLDAPIGELNALQHSNTQRIVNDDLFSVLAASSAESLKAKDVIGTGNLKGIVIGIVSTGNSPYDREKKKQGTRDSKPVDGDGEETIQNTNASPYAYVVNIPELSFMLPAVPSIADIRYQEVIKVYRDNGFSFRVRGGQPAENAGIGDTVYVNYQNLGTLSGGYYVGRASVREGEHPGHQEPGNPTGGKAWRMEKWKSKNMGPTAAAYLASVDQAKDDVSSFKCAGNISPVHSAYGTKRQIAYGGGLWHPQQTDIAGNKGNNYTQLEFFIEKGTNGMSGGDKTKIGINKTVESAFKLVRNALAQDPDVLQYFAYTSQGLYPPNAPSSAGYSSSKAGQSGYKFGLSDVRRSCAHRKIATPCPPPTDLKAEYEEAVKGGYKCYRERGADGKLKNLYWGREEWKHVGLIVSGKSAGCPDGNLGNHGLGIAVDINYIYNPYSTTFKCDHPPKLQAIFEMYGFALGSKFGGNGGKYDTQHFDFVGDPAQADALWKKCQDANEAHYYDTNWVSKGKGSGVKSALESGWVPEGGPSEGNTTAGSGGSSTSVETNSTGGTTSTSTGWTDFSKGKL
jgi:hypothetical protein